MNSLEHSLLSNYKKQIPYIPLRKGCAQRLISDLINISGFLLARPITSCLIQSLVNNICE
jgi:hypothetical protein